MAGTHLTPEFQNMKIFFEGLKEKKMIFKEEKTEFLNIKKFSWRMRCMSVASFCMNVLM